MSRLALTAAVALCACSEPYVLLEIDARDAVRDTTDVTVTVTDASRQEAELDVALTDTLGFPKTLVIRTDGRTGPFTVDVAAFGADEEPVGRGTGVTATGDVERLSILLEPDELRRQWGDPIRAITYAPGRPFHRGVAGWFLHDRVGHVVAQRDGTSVRPDDPARSSMQFS